MKYNFDEIIERRGSNSYKWDSAEAHDVLPLWVADMDFRVAQPIIDALHKRVDHGIFGYVHVPESFYDAAISWFHRRHGWNIDRRHMLYTTGVVPALSAVIKAFTQPGDKVMLLTPVYNCFFSSVRNNGCQMTECQLHNEGERYTIDFADLEKKAADPEVKLLVLCNPHNPAGRVWTRAELEQIDIICRRHDVFVVSDEIHCEFTFSPHTYIPFATISAEARSNSVSLISPSKTFNIAGLQTAIIVCQDDTRRRLIDRALNINEVCDINPFGVVALEAAYNHGEEWLTQLIDYLRGNYTFLRAFFETRLPQFPVYQLEGTYLVWVDCRKLGLKSDDLCDQLRRRAGVLLNSGTMYGTTAGEGFLRINIACPRPLLSKALLRLQEGFESIMAEQAAR